MKRFLKVPVNPIEIKGNTTVDELVRQFSGISFQARNLGVAVEIWERMLDDDALIFLGLAGAMVPAGMRRVVSFLLKHRFVDCLVSTGANLFHDCHETIGYSHWKGTHHVDDVALKQESVDRIYDTFASEAEFQKTDVFISDFAREIPQDGPLTTREFLGLLGKKLSGVAKGEGILTSAYKAGVPVYCPGLADSSIGIAIAAGRSRQENSLVFDIISDVVETARLASFASSGVVYVGGGLPKNFIQQTEVTATLMGLEVGGHKYAIQVITDPPHWGGLSGCTFEEAQSWGKISPQASRVTVYSDATIALPMISTALAARRENNISRRRLPKFVMGRTLQVSF
jgi:deoxyhypusine synthase